MDNQDVKILKDDLESKDRVVTDQAQFVSHQYREQEFQKLDSKASEALSKIDVTVEKLLKAERLNTLKWLSDTPIADKQQQLRTQIDKVNKDSGRWLLETDEYKDWLTKSHSFVWLYGASGCGKSSLCSTVVKNVTEAADNDPSMIVAYWYFDNADGSTQNLQRFLRSVLRKIAAKSSAFPEAVCGLAKKHELANSLPSTSELIQALKEAVTGLEENMFLVLDAIDEYQAGNKTQRGEFFDFLVELTEAKLPKLHLLITSIPDSRIEDALKRRTAEIDVEKPNSVDLDAYLKTTIAKYADSKRWSSELTEKIYHALSDDGYEVNHRFSYFANI